MVIAWRQVTSDKWQMTNLDDKLSNIHYRYKHLEQVTQFRVLGVTTDSNLDCGDLINRIIKECFTAITTLKKLKWLPSFYIRKHLIELDYCKALFISGSQYKKRQLQKVQNAAAIFVCNKYGKIDDKIKLNWLSIKERICVNSAN